MIQAAGIGVKYGDRVLLDNLGFTLKKGDRVGLIGRNGAGKSTLLKILANKITPDQGHIQYQGNVKVGYLEQEIEFKNQDSIIDETLKCFKKINEWNREIDQINSSLETRTDYESESYFQLVDRLSDLSEQLGILDGGNLEGKAVKVLKGLGFKDEQMSDSVTSLSGGWKMRIELAKLLLTEPELLLLDEPTNHLDIESIIWLEGYLVKYAGTVIIISHDARFLDNVTNRVIEIELGRLIDIKGNYAHFRTEKEKQKEILESAYVNQQKSIAQKERTISRFMAKATKTSMAQSMQKQLDKVERIEIPQENSTKVRMRFATVPRSARVLLKGKNLSKTYGSNQVLSGLDVSIERQNRVAFVGQNGQGKSTLAKILVGELKLTDGILEKGENIYLSYYAQNETDSLPMDKTVLEVAEDLAPPELRTQVRNILGSFLFSGEDVEKKIMVLSGGEKARLALACKMMHPANLVVLDEPTNHLDIQAKMVLKNALLKYSGTLIVVSHDREFLTGLTDTVLEFRSGSLKEYLGDVDYYLNKRKVEDIREVEKREKSAVESNVLKESKNENTNHKKQIEKQIKSIEKKIDKMESRIGVLNEKLIARQDYGSDEYIDLTKQVQDIKENKNIAESLWEELVEQL